MKLSIIICTFNRAPMLKRVLEDLKSQYSQLVDYQKREIELVLVDNNSSDETKDLAIHYHNQATLPMVYVFEDKQGLSFARNAGVAKARGELIAFLDDDIYLNSDWLIKAYDIAENNTEASAYGGRVIPDWEVDKPDWVNLEPPYDVIQSVFPSHNYGEREAFYPLDLGSRRVFNPIGANMMFRRELFEKYGDFRVDLGVTGSAVGLCEDTEFIRHISAYGEKVKYTPDLIVHHPVPMRRMTKEAISHWYFVLGKSLYLFLSTNRDGSPNGSMNSFIGVPAKLKPMMPQFMAECQIDEAPLYLYCKLFAVGIIKLFCAFDAKKSFWWSLQAHKTKGEMQGARELLRLCEELETKQPTY